MPTLTHRELHDLLGTLLEAEPELADRSLFVYPYELGTGEPGIVPMVGLKRSAAGGAVIYSALRLGSAAAELELDPPDTLPDRYRLTGALPADDAGARIGGKVEFDSWPLVLDPLNVARQAERVARYVERAGGDRRLIEWTLELVEVPVSA